VQQLLMAAFALLCFVDAFPSSLLMALELVCMIYALRSG